MILRDKSMLIVLFPVLCAGSAVFAQTHSPAYDEQLKAIQAQVREKQHTLTAASDEFNRLQYQLGQSARELSAAKRRLENSAENISVLKTKISTLNRQADDLSARHTYNLALLAKGLRSMQHDAGIYRFSYLLSADDWNNFERKAVYYGYFSRERERRLSQLSKQLSGLYDIRIALKKQERLFESEREQQQKILRKLDYEREKKQLIFSALEQKIKRTQVEIATLKKDAEELQLLIERFASSSSLQFHTLKGKLPWPIDTPFNPRIGSSKLPGVFLVAGASTEVRSIYDGYVVFSDWFRSYGMLLIIDHGDGYMSLYANNDALYKDIGDTVRGGERIAEVGSGGTSSDTGLYFEIRKFNDQLDPKLWCRRQNS